MTPFGPRHQPRQPPHLPHEPPDRRELRCGRRTRPNQQPPHATGQLVRTVVGSQSRHEHEVREADRRGLLQVHEWLRTVWG